MKNKKLILAMYIGVIALSVATVSMSVAWYATSRQLYINSIDITIDADRGLEISTNKDDGYVDYINHTELDATGVFVPLTTAHSSLWMSEKKDRPVFYDESKAFDAEDITTYQAVETGSGYFTQKFYLKSDDDVYVTINPEKTFIKQYETELRDYNKEYARSLYEEYQTFQDEYYKNLSVDEIEERLDRVIKAMRFSILIKDENEYSYTIIDPLKEGDTLLGGVLDNDVDRYYDYYQVGNTDEYRERVYGEIIASPEHYVYDDASDSDTSFLDANDAPNAFNARHKKGIKKFNLEESIKKGLEIKKEESIDLKDFNNEVKPFYFPVYRDTPKEVVVSIYIEGWDLESVNYTMGAAFISELSFKIYREM